MAFNLVFPCEVDISGNTTITQLKTDSITTPKVITPLIQDVSGNTGSPNNVLTSTATGIKWGTPSPAPLNYFGGVYQTASTAITTSNTLLATRTFTSSSATATYLIIANFTVSQVAGTNVAFWTLSKEAGSTATTAGANLAGTGTLTTPINTSTAYYLASTYNGASITTATGQIALIDTPAISGAVAYGLWGVTSLSINNVKWNISVVQLTS